jgi:hypothetical protein
MNCPRCASEPLDERVREGVTIDVCQGCRGIWLDRGELEKLIARSVQERGRPAYHEDHDRGPPSSDDYRRGPRKRSWLDIFD